MVEPAFDLEPAAAAAFDRRSRFEDRCRNGFRDRSQLSVPISSLVPPALAEVGAGQTGRVPFSLGALRF